MASSFPYLTSQVIQSLRSPAATDDRRSIFTDLVDGTLLSGLRDITFGCSDGEDDDKDRSSDTLDDLEQILNTESQEALTLQTLLQIIILSALTSPQNKPHVAQLCDWNHGIKLPARRLIACASRARDSTGPSSAKNSVETFPPPSSSSVVDVESPSPVQPLRIRSSLRSATRYTNMGDQSSQYRRSDSLREVQSEVAAEFGISTSGEKSGTLDNGLVQHIDGGSATPCPVTRQDSNSNDNENEASVAHSTSRSVRTQSLSPNGVSGDERHNLRSSTRVPRRSSIHVDSLKPWEPSGVRPEKFPLDTPITGKSRSQSLSQIESDSQWLRLPKSLDPFSTPCPTKGDLIDLPDVPTNSETKGSPYPSWTNTPALHEGLKHQTYSEAERIFGHWITNPRIDSDGESLPATISPSIRPAAPNQNADTNMTSSHHTERPLVVPESARQLRSRPLHRDSAVDLTQDESLRKGMLARPPKRLPRGHRVPSKGKEKIGPKDVPMTPVMESTPKDVPMIPVMESTQDLIRHSYHQWFPTIPLQFGLSHEGYFNPYRLSPNRKEAILDEKKIRQIREQAYRIADKIPFRLHDSETVDFGADRFMINDLLISSGQNGSVLDVVREIEKKMRRNKDIENLLSFFHLSVLRVYQRMVSEEDFHKIRQESSKYENITMDVYLCLHGLCCRLGPAWNGRHLSLIMYLLKRGVGLTSLNATLTPTRRPLAFHLLLSCLNERQLEPVSQEVGSPNCATALDSIWELVRDAKGVDISTVKDALAWTSSNEIQCDPSYLRGLVSYNPRPVVMITPKSLTKSAPQLKRMRSNQNIRGNPSNETFPFKRPCLEGNPDSGFCEGSTNERSNNDNVNQRLAEVLSRDVESLAKRLQDNKQGIIVESDPGCPFRSYGDWTSIGQLKPGQWLGEDIINVVLGSLASEGGRSTTYLGTQIYQELRKAQFGNSKSWTEGIPRDKQWSLAICEGHHWIAVLIDWKLRSIEYYDSQSRSGVTEQRHKTITANIKAWLNYLDENTIWHSSRAQGPLQSQDDVSSCGVYSTIVLGMWSVGQKVRSSEPSKFTPDMYRKEMLSIILRAEEEGRIKTG